MRVRVRGLALIGLVAVVAGAAGASGPAQAGGMGDGLFGRPFLSIGVVKNGERHELVDDTRLRLKFVRDEDGNTVEWHVGCNYFGGELKISPQRLMISEIAGTDIGCGQPRLRQDRWIARFIGAHPKWSRTGGKLRLVRNDDVIRLRRAEQS